MGCYKLVIILAICFSAIDDVIGASRQLTNQSQFTSKYYDLSGSMRRYTNCSGELPALKDSKLNETDYLMNQMKLFMDQTQLDNEQWANLTAFLDTVCQPAALGGYRISVYIDVNKFSGPKGKSNRCQAIDDALDSFYYVFRRPSINRQQPLDFSEPQFFANYSMKQASKGYNLTDLVNIIWIQSEVPLDNVCSFTDNLKSYINLRVSNSTAQDRLLSTGGGYVSTISDYLNRFLDSLFGFQRRIYWDSTNSLEHVYIGLGHVGSSIGSHFRSTSNRISNLFSKSNITSIPSVPAIPTPK